MRPPPVLYRVRRDLRLGDNAALSAAIATGGPVIPVFVRDASVDALGAAPKWRLEQGLAAFDRALRARGSRLVLRAGDAGAVLDALIAETGANAVFWNRSYDPETITRDSAIKSALKARDVAVQSCAGHLLFEPWDVQTGAGGPYRVFTPFWRAVQGRDPGALTPAPMGDIPAPDTWPNSALLAEWQLGRAMQRGGDVAARFAMVGEDAAMDQLHTFLNGPVKDYAVGRDMVAQAGTSTLSEPLSLGEISARQIWHAVQNAAATGVSGAEAFLRQLVWRDFAWHLYVAYPGLPRDNWRDGWQEFAWRDAPDNPDLIAWQRGQTGVDMVDAAMRALYATGTMHNRARMITASFLTKHLLVDWRCGLRWFADTLIDWDPASNAMGWQWVAGCGPDAAPYFRVFNPDTQAAKYDPDQTYRQNWLSPDGAGTVAFVDATPRAWRIRTNSPRPSPIIGLKAGRDRALAAYGAMKRGQATAPG